jgi:hypothetical protein
VTFPDLGVAPCDGVAPIESGEEFHGLDLVEVKCSWGEWAGGADGEVSGGLSEWHEEADYAPSLSGFDSSALHGSFTRSLRTTRATIPFSLSRGGPEQCA